MKIKVFFILILTLSLLFAGCKPEPAAPTVPVQTTAPTEPPTPKAGLALRQKADDDADALALQQTLEEQGYEVLVKDGENDQSRQNEQVKALLDEGCQMLVVQPVMTTGLEILVEQVKPTGVPLIILDHQPEQAVLESYDKLVFLGADHSQAGTVQAKLLEQLPMKGDLSLDGITSLVLILGPEDHLDSAKRSAEFMAAIPADTHVILETVSAEWTKDGGRSAAAQLMSKYGPDIELMVTFDEQMALGALEAIDNGGWEPGQDLYVLTVGNSSEVRTQVEQGRISGIAWPDKEARLVKLSELIAALAAGEQTEKVHYIDYLDQLTILT